MKLILYLSQSYKKFDLDEASEVLSVSKREMRRAVSKLETKKLIEITEQKGKSVKEEKDLEHITEITLLPLTEAILKDLVEENNRMEQMKLSGFSAEELEQYALLSERVKQNIRNSLK